MRQLWLDSGFALGVDHWGVLSDFLEIKGRDVVQKRQEKTPPTEVTLQETGSRGTSQVFAEALGRAPRAPGHGWWGQANLSGDCWGMTPKANCGGMSLSLHVGLHRGQSRSMP